MRKELPKDVLNSILADLKMMLSDIEEGRIIMGDATEERVAGIRRRIIQLEYMIQDIDAEES